MKSSESETDALRRQFRNRIDHVVVLMLENRSFDHMFGFLDHPMLPNLVPNEHPNPLDPEVADSVSYEPTPDADYALTIDPPHSHLSVMKQLNGLDPSPMNGFVSAYVEKALGRETVPEIKWFRIKLLLAVACLLIALLARLVGTSWQCSGLLSAVLAATVVWKMRLLRGVIPHWTKTLLWALLGCLALGLAARIFGPSWWTALGFGALLFPAGAIFIKWMESLPLYFHPPDPRQAYEAAPEVMRCMPNHLIPALGKLARSFVVCSAWHCSVPGATWPNRNFAHAATSDGTTDIRIGFYRNRTIFEVLAKAGASWRIYRHGTAQLMAFKRLWTSGEWKHNWREFSDFERDVSQGDLPNYTFIEPMYDGPTSNSQHPGNNRGPGPDQLYDFQRGEALIAQVYEALRARPEVFNRTILLITYDEHGGLFDHATPPTGVAVPGRKLWVSFTRKMVSWFVTHAASQFDFKTLGPRVPAVVVSPWIDPGVIETQFDHSSIVATVRKMFAAGSRRLNKREDVANTFAGLVTKREQPRDLSTLPDLSDAFAPRPMSNLQAGRLGPAPSRTDLSDQLDRLLIKVDKQVDKQLKKRKVPETLPSALGPESPRDRILNRFQRYCEGSTELAREP